MFTLLLGGQLFSQDDDATNHQESIITEDSLRKNQPQYFKNLYSETAFSIPKNQISYQILWIPQLPAASGHIFNYGITDQLSLNAGFETASIVYGNDPVFLIAPKYRFTKDENNIQWAAGSTSAYLPGDSELYGTLYFIGTLGNKRSNFTFGLGTGHFNFNEFGAAYLQLSGLLSISNSFAAVLDQNLVFAGGVGSLGTAGLRYFNDKISIDLSVTTGQGTSVVLGAHFNFN